MYRMKVLRGCVCGDENVSYEAFQHCMQGPVAVNKLLR